MAGNFFTPNSNTTRSELSSVFMTPSSSTGKPIYQKPRVLTPLPPLSFLSPAASPEMSRTALKAQETEEHKDILLELREYGIPELVDRILSFLSPADLYNCLQVSRNWHDVISSKPRYIEQIRSHLKSLTEPENIKKSSLPLNFNSSFGARRVLGTISQNSINSHSRNLPPLPSSSSYKAEQTQKHHPCPDCGSPARQLNLRRTVCTNPICRLDFCQRCFRRWHEGECVENRGSRSPKRAQSTLIACSQKSKKRLRRL